MDPVREDADLLTPCLARNRNQLERADAWNGALMKRQWGHCISLAADFLACFFLGHRLARSSSRTVESTRIQLRCFEEQFRLQPAAADSPIFIGISAECQCRRRRC